MKRTLPSLLLLLALAAAHPNCGTPSAKLLILGTDHMDNPGLDAINIEADDVTAPRRQAERAAHRCGSAAAEAEHRGESARAERAGARRERHYPYLDHLLPKEGNPALYEGADVLTNWYKRNFRMFANLARITNFENDRVLLIVGSGHLQILRDLAHDAAYFCLEEAQAYLE